jgi:hypothetical protein
VNDTWSISPGAEWLDRNKIWLLGSEKGEKHQRCTAVLSGFRCELREHPDDVSHMTTALTQSGEKVATT